MKKIAPFLVFPIAATMLTAVTLLPLKTHAMISHVIHNSIATTKIHYIRPTSYNIASVGDKCNFTFAPTVGDGSDVNWNGNPYIVQEEWDNAQSDCAITGP